VAAVSGQEVERGSSRVVRRSGKSGSESKIVWIVNQKIASGVCLSV
jgi:hypothetical protein